MLFIYQVLMISNMVSTGILHCVLILMLLPFVVQGEGIICEANFCDSMPKDCAYERVCPSGFQSVPYATDCGCCTRCLETLDEGDDCSTGPFKYPVNQSDPDGSYAWYGHPPVCKYGLDCETNGTSAVCKRDCRSDPETGTCEAAIRSWYYSPEYGECREFMYGGCGGNFNNYRTKHLCTQICNPGIRCEADFCHLVDCAPESVCPRGFKSVPNAGECGCCSACVRTLDEGIACITGAYPQHPNPDGSYTWRAHDPVCKYGLYCRSDLAYPVCSQDIRCEADFCHLVDCAPESVCPRGFKSVPNAGECGCCSACVRTLDEGIGCIAGAYTQHPNPDGLYTWRGHDPVCKDGLYCRNDLAYPVCRQENCAGRLYAALAQDMLPGQYVPRCDADGSYSAKQCGPGPECHCVDKQNRRIGHYSIPIWEAENMTCFCARELDLSQGEMRECTELGNFCEFGACSSGRVLLHATMTSLLLIVTCLCLLIGNVYGQSDL